MVLPDDPHHDALGLRQDDHQQDNQIAAKTAHRQGKWRKSTPDNYDLWIRIARLASATPIDPRVGLAREEILRLRAKRSDLEESDRRNGAREGGKRAMMWSGRDAEECEKVLKSRSSSFIGIPRTGGDVQREN